MSESSTARRYASALYAEAKERGVTEAVTEDIAVVAQSLRDSRDLRLFFSSPVIRREKKTAIVDRLFEDRIGELVRRFLHLLIEKGREELVQDVAGAYQALRDRAEGIVEATVQSALPLGEADQQEVAAILGSLTGKTVRLVLQEKPDLLGGLVIRVGDTVYDGSVQHQLAVLRERMERGSYLTN